jgi:hypothetical protein
VPKTFKVNPYNVFEMRRVSFCPPHFESILLTPTYNINKALDEWILTNLSGRYYIGTDVDCKEGPIKQKVKIGFEKSSELSYFMLACPFLKYNK